MKRLLAASVNGSFCQHGVFSVWTSTGESALTASHNSWVYVYLVTSDLACVALRVCKMGMSVLKKAWHIGGGRTYGFRGNTSVKYNFRQLLYTSTFSILECWHWGAPAGWLWEGCGSWSADQHCRRTVLEPCSLQPAIGCKGFINICEHCWWHWEQCW